MQILKVPHFHISKQLHLVLRSLQPHNIEFQVRQVWSQPSPSSPTKNGGKNYELRRWPAGSKENCYQSLWPQKIEHRENAKATWQHQPTFFFDSERPFDLRILNLRDGALHLGKLGKSTKSQVNHQVIHIDIIVNGSTFLQRSDNFVTGFPRSPFPHLLIVFLEANISVNHLFFPFLLLDAWFFPLILRKFHVVSFGTPHLALKDYPQVSWRKALDLSNSCKQKNNFILIFIFASFFHLSFLPTFFTIRIGIKSPFKTLPQALAQNFQGSPGKQRFKKKKTISRTLNKKTCRIPRNFTVFCLKSFCLKSRDRLCHDCGMSHDCKELFLFRVGTSDTKLNPKKNVASRKLMKHHRCPPPSQVCRFTKSAHPCACHFDERTASRPIRIWPNGCIFEQLPNQLDTLSASEDSSIHKLVASFSCLSSTILALHILCMAFDDSLKSRDNIYIRVACSLNPDLVSMYAHLRPKWQSHKVKTHTVSIKKIRLSGFWICLSN